MSDIGEIIGRLRLDTGNWFRDLERAKAAAEELGGVDPKVAVTAETRQGRRELEFTQAAADRLDRTDPNVRVTTTGAATAATELGAVEKASDRVGVASTRSERAQAQSRNELGRFTRTAGQAGDATDHLAGSTRRASGASAEFTGEARRQADALAVLIKVAVAAGPALVPVAAGAVGLTGALGGLGAAGILAGTGIARGLKTGTADARIWRGVIDDLLNDVHRLQGTAADGILPGAEQAVDRLDAAMPGLNRQTGQFASQLGRILPTGMDAIVTALERADPLLVAGGESLTRFVTGLDNAAHSQGFSDFIDYAIQNLPRTEKLLEDALDLAGDFLREMAPYGETILEVADGTIKLADALTPLAPLIWGTWTAFQAWRGATAIIGGIRSAVALLGVEAAATGAKVAAAGAAGSAGGAASRGGGVGVAAGVPALLAFSAMQVMSAGSASLNRGNGNEISTEQVPHRTGRQLTSAVNGWAGFGANNGLTQLANMPGVARDFYAGAGGDLIRGTGMGNLVMGGQINGTKNLKATDSGLAGMVRSGDPQQMQQAKDAMAAITAEAKRQKLPVSALKDLFPEYTSAVRETASASKAAEAAQRNYNDSFEGQVVAQKTAAGLAQGVEAANLGVKDSLAGLDQMFKQNGHTLDENTAKGRANRAAVLSVAQGISATADAVTKQTGSALAGRVAQDQYANSLVKTLTPMLGNRKAAQEYVNELLGIPKNVDTEADLKIAKAQRKAEQAREYAQLFARGDYKAILTGDFTPAQKKAARAKGYADAYARGDYDAILSGDYTKAQKDSATAAKAARDYMNGNYEAALKADPSLANTNIAQARRNAVQFGNLRPTPTLSAKDNTGPAVRSAKDALNSVKDKTVTIHSVYVSSGKPPSKTAGNYYGSATGGTVGSDAIGTMRALRGMAGGGTVNGAGSAASDTAGVFRLAMGEEVISNLYGQADRNRAMLKAINTGDSARIRQTAAEQYGGQAPVQVVISPRLPGMSVEEMVDVKIAAAQSAQQRENVRVQKRGWQARGLRA